ncbi:MAG: primosomal protein N', partial [Zetaproteobacteria bacterium]
EPPEGVALKPTADLLDETPLYDSARSQWLARLGRYYLATEAEIWQLGLAWAQGLDYARLRAPELRQLARADPELARAFPDRRARTLSYLVRKGIDAPHHRVRRALSAGLLQEEPVPPPWEASEGASQLELTDEQAAAARRIAESLGRFSVFVLDGPTGSGKTEVYFAAARRAAERGWQTLVLLPEIALTPQWLARARARGFRVAAWHSGLDARARLRVLKHLDGLDMLVGPRSALFVPLPRLGLIVVDEEHDASFKAQQPPFVHARDGAVLLAQSMKAPIVLGSATPSCEAVRLVRTNRAERLVLTHRFAAAPIPKVEIVDMRAHKGALSPALLQALDETFAEGGQAILFLNRRGFAPALACTACGHIPGCPHCTLRLVWHRRLRALVCHGCGFSRPAPAVCEQCGEEALVPLGAGCERIEHLLAERFPGRRFARLDRDAVRSARQLEKLLVRFREGAIDALVGTQIVAKGHHFPNVRLVAVVLAEQGLGIPDFRAMERWRQLIVQVVGRAGRGANPGRVLIQSYQPDAAWLREVCAAPYWAQAERELSVREEHRFPPWSRWVRVVWSARDRKRVWDAAGAWVDEVRKKLSDLVCVGPAWCVRERLNRQWRVEAVVQDPSRRRLPWALAPFVRAPLPRGVERRVDVDPWDWM